MKVSAKKIKKDTYLKLGGQSGQTNELNVWKG